MGLSVNICRDCRFYVVDSSSNGWCHRCAPRPRQEESRYFVDGEIRAIWPYVSIEDFCGDFEKQHAH